LIRLILGSILIALLCGCSGHTKNKNESVSWQCSGEMGTSSWRCDQRAIRNGKEIEAPLKTVVTRPRLETKLGTAGATKEVIFGRQDDTWQNHLPTLDGNYPTAGRNSLKPINVADAPVPEPDYEDSFSTNYTEDVVATSKEKMVIVDQPPAASQMPEGYTVQLAALETRKQVDKFIAHYKLKDLPINYYLTQQDGQTWHVLAWGRFESQERALEGWRQQSQTHPGIKVWIRSIRSLQTATSKTP